MNNGRNGNVMKKVISAFISGVMALSAVTVPVMTASAAADSWNDDDIMPLLDELGIMNGDGNGDYFLDAYVNREEMAKIAVNSSENKDKTAVGLKVSPFNDVDPTRWSAAYILNGTQNGLFTGYLDGSFRPYNTVTYEEAVTMMLKVLGYTDSDFGVSYPYGQVSLADNIDLTDNMDADYGQQLTRRQVARMVYNALSINRATTKTPLINVFDAQFVEDAVLIATPNEDSTLGKNKVFTSSGKYSVSDGFNFDYVGLEGDMIIKNSKDLLCFVPDRSDSSGTTEKYVIYSLLNDSVVGYKNGTMQQIDLNGTTTCYKGSQTSTYAAVKTQMEMGDVLRVKYDRKGDVDYIVYEEGKMEGPTKVTSTDMVNSLIKDSSTQVMRDGNKVTAASIQLNDVVYYSADLNMVLAYSTKVTGIYESASPSREQPNSITISGKQYNVESAQAFTDLSSSGPFKYGDTITVILGKDGDVAGVVTSNASSGQTESGTKYGLVTSSGRKNFTNNDGTTYSSYYVTIVAADGNTYEYATTTDCSNMICAVARANFTDGKTTVSRVSSSANVSGRVDAQAMKIGSTKLADDCKILDTAGYYTTDAPLYKQIYAQRLDGVDIAASSVRHCEKNSAGEITELILMDVTGDCYEYGMVMGASSSSQSSSGTKVSSFYVDISGNSYTAASKSGVSAYTPCKAYSADKGLEIKDTLKSYSGTAKNLTQSSIEINGTKYLLSDKVAVYLQEGTTTYSKMSLNDAIDGNYSYSAYYDKTEAKGGSIRVIIAKAK